MRAMVHVRDVVSLTAYVTSVNLSLGEFGPGDLCGVPGAMRSWQAIISELSRMGVAVVIASGNDGFKNRIRFPSCVPGAIAIGNSLIGFTGSDAGVNVTSNASPLLALLAPGTGIWSAIPGNNWAPMDGTSMASPLVAGGITSLRSAVDWPLADIRGSLVATGQNVIDAGNGVAYPRVNFAAAWNQLVAAAPATPFIYMKDTVGDTGNQPDPASVGRPLYESPDVWVRNTNDGFRNLHVHQNPEHGQPNYIYARVRNKGNASASGFVVAYYVPGGNAAVNSADWKEIGRSQVLSASPMGSTFHEIFWGSPPKPGHYCLLLKWFPAGTTPTLSFNDMPSAVANDRTLVWRNINIVDASSGPVSFEGGFVLDTSKATHIAIEFDSSMPEGEQWYMDVELPREAVINFSEPTMRYARLLSDGNPIRLRIPVRRGTLYLADLRTRGAPGVLPFKFTVHRLEGGRPRSPIPIGLRVQEVSNVQLHKSGADLDKGRPVNRGGSTYRLKL